MITGIICETVLIVVILTPAIMEAISIKRNSMPRINDGENEERIIFCYTIKTREMFEIVKR